VFLTTDRDFFHTIPHIHDKHAGIIVIALRQPNRSTIGNAVVFRFNAGLGLSYRIEDSTDLQNWNTLETPIVGAGVEVTRYYPVAGQPKRYFRVKKN